MGIRRVLYDSPKSLETLAESYVLRYESHGVGLDQGLPVSYSFDDLVLFMWGRGRGWGLLEPVCLLVKWLQLYSCGSWHIEGRASVCCFIQEILIFFTETRECDSLISLQRGCSMPASYEYLDTIG